ncbi:PTS fructose transporter subunit IIB [uncultured Enorma sp.]|uniref:PTS fructose transporter subunit IIB n=1 Tax=uncultured Enorma sp. TaxID=1714346 RepID=UPI00259A8678|nr:fructose PTS transporter subunit IIB [uncultured Enorma sp.]
MKIVGITACPTGIAHTYITKQKLIDAAEALGHTCHIETQGSIGAEDELTPEEIAEADIAILAVDVKITGEDRFAHTPTVKVPTEIVMRDATGLIKTVEAKLRAAGRIA